MVYKAHFTFEEATYAHQVVNEALGTNFTSNTGTYTCPKYEVELDGDNGDVIFEKLDREYIKEIMNKLSHALGKENYYWVVEDSVKYKLVPEYDDSPTYKYKAVFRYLTSSDKAKFKKAKKVLKAFPYDKDQFYVNMDTDDWVSISFNNLDYIGLSDIAEQITNVFGCAKGSYDVIIIEDGSPVMYGAKFDKLADELRGPKEEDAREEDEASETGEEDEEEEASDEDSDEESDEYSDEEEYTYSSSKPKNVEEVEGALYALFSTSDYRKENSVNFVGVFTNKQVAIDRISQIEAGKNMMDKRWQTYRTPRKFRFENIPVYINGRPVNTDNLYVLLPDTNKPWPFEDVVRYENPWRIEALIGDEQSPIPQFEKEFGIKFEKGHTYNDMYEYHGNDFGITFREYKGEAALYLRSLVIDKEYVIRIVKRFFKCFKTVYGGTSSKKICKYWIKNINEEKFINFNSQFMNTTNGNIYIVQPITPQ
jgi:hypothetical protein